MLFVISCAILATKRWARSWSQCTGSQPFPFGRLSLLLSRLRSPSQPKNIIVLWPVPSYTAWWHRHIGVNNMPKVVTQLCPSRNWMHDLLITSPMRYCYTTAPARHHLLNVKRKKQLVLKGWSGRVRRGLGGRWWRCRCCEYDDSVKRLLVWLWRSKWEPKHVYYTWSTVVFFRTWRSGIQWGELAGCHFIFPTLLLHVSSSAWKCSYFSHVSVCNDLFCGHF